MSCEREKKILRVYERVSNVAEEGIEMRFDVCT